MQNPIVTMKTFYSEEKVNFKDIDIFKLRDIINRAKKINKLYLNTDFKKNLGERYLIIMELINSNYRRNMPINNQYAAGSIVEKYLLFMFSVDPNFEAAIICGSEDRIYDIKRLIREKLGVYDPTLIKIENYVIKKFLSEKKRNEIQEEIERRAFK